MLTTSNLPSASFAFGAIVHPPPKIRAFARKRFATVVARQIVVKCTTTRVDDFLAAVCSMATAKESARLTTCPLVGNQSGHPSFTRASQRQRHAKGSYPEEKTRLEFAVVLCNVTLLPSSRRVWPSVNSGAPATRR